MLDPNFPSEYHDRWKTTDPADSLPEEEIPMLDNEDDDERDPFFDDVERDDWDDPPDPPEDFEIGGSE